jgi:hypothetical protein
MNHRRVAGQWPRRDLGDLTEAYEAWPGSVHDKGRILAVLLRLRIETLVLRLPPTAVARAPDTNLVDRRLMAFAGEPGLMWDARRRRLAVVHAAVTSYRALCDVLHGRRPEYCPPAHDLRAWTEAIDHLDHEVTATPSGQPIAAIPPQPSGGTAGLATGSQVHDVAHPDTSSPAISSTTRSAAAATAGDSPSP